MILCRTAGAKKEILHFSFSQSNFNNWIAGGENNLSGNLGINYDFNYKKDKLTWDNKIIASYGLLQTKNADFEKKPMTVSNSILR